jgi:hypothetical protein
MSIFSEHLQGCSESCVLKFLLSTKLLASHFLVITIHSFEFLHQLEGGERYLSRCLNVMVR